MSAHGLCKNTSRSRRRFERPCTLHCYADFFNLGDECSQKCGQAQLLILMTGSLPRLDNCKEGFTALQEEEAMVLNDSNKSTLAQVSFDTNVPSRKRINIGSGSVTRMPSRVKLIEMDVYWTVWCASRYFRAFNGDSFLRAENHTETIQTAPGVASE